MQARRYEELEVQTDPGVFLQVPYTPRIHTH
jgi:hypothetical protein